MIEAISQPNRGVFRALFRNSGDSDRIRLAAEFHPGTNCITLMLDDGSARYYPVEPEFAISIAQHLLREIGIMLKGRL